MALEAEILINNYGIPQDFARDLLNFTKTDLEAAIKIIESSEKDIVVLKAKFISNKKMYSGAFLLFFNFQTRIPEYMFCVVSNNPSLTKIKIENSWGDIFSIMLEYLTEPESDVEMASKSESQILSADNANYLATFFTDTHTIDLVNIKRFILSELSKVFADSGIILKMINEQTNIFHFTTFLKATRVGMKVQSQLKMNLITLLNIKVEPVLAPLGGVDLEKMEIYDELLVKIVDSREIVNFILGFIDTSALSPGTLYGRIVYNQKAPNLMSNLVIIEFAPGIYGRFMIGEKIRVQVKKHQHRKGETAVPQNPVPEQPGYHIEDYLGQSLTNQDQLANDAADRGKKVSVYSIILIIAASLAFVLLIFLWLIS